jgi:hypothetical protein
MLTHSYFGVGFWRGLNSAAEVFAPYSGSYERSPIGQMLAVRIIPGGADRLLSMAEKELTHRIEDARRGRYLGWSLATVAVVAAAVVSLCHGSWQVSVALVGVPVLGAVHALIQGRKGAPSRYPVR